jgi:hypothetical protein
MTDKQVAKIMLEVGLFAALTIAANWDEIRERDAKAEADLADYIEWAKAEDMRIFGYLPFSDAAYAEQYEYG